MHACRKTILVVEDDQAEREALARLLRLERFEVRTAREPAEALALIGEPIDLVVTDLCMGKNTGLDLIRSWRARRPFNPFIFLTAFGTVDSAVSAMKLGAAEFLTKPADPSRLLALIHKHLANGTSPPAEVQTGDRLRDGPGFDKIVGRSAALHEICEQTYRAAQTDSTVLILGESGTGKELIAEAIFRNSARSQAPFVVFNIAAVPDTLMESELFGHVKGAFSVGLANRVGRFQAANDGTLFLDEIGDCPLTLQPKLLRVLESHTLSPVGSNEELAVNVRIIAATSRPLGQLKASGKFREDLFYRLNVLTIHLPPLRERREDIAPLTRHFLAHIAHRLQRPPLEVEAELLQEMEALPWPGNIRQLRNCLERMSVMATGPILTRAQLPRDIRDDLTRPAAEHGSERMEAIERQAITDALERFAGNRTRAAQFLGISVRTLQRRLRDWEAKNPGPAAD